MARLETHAAGMTPATWPHDADRWDIATARELFEQLGHLVPVPGRLQIGMALEH